jgi:hypothetical protein
MGGFIIKEGAMIKKGNRCAEEQFEVEGYNILLAR